MVTEHKEKMGEVFGIQSTPENSITVIQKLPAILRGHVA